MENRLMAIVNGKEIFESDVDRFIELMGNRAISFKNEKGKKTLCEEIIKQELIHIDALDRKFDEIEAFKKEMEEITRSILAKYYLNDLFSNIVVDDDKIKKYYDENKNLYMSKYTFRAKHILVESEQKANQLKRDYENGKSFEDLAKENSICPSKEVGGDLGEFSQGQMVLEFENACIKAKIGEVTEPVKTQFGYHIIKINEKNDAKELAFDEVKDKIVEQVRRQKEQELYNEKITELKDKYEVKMNI